MVARDDDGTEEGVWMAEVVPGSGDEDPPCTGAERRVYRHAVLPRNPGTLVVHPDLIRLSHMHRPAVLQNLLEHFERGLIYTLSGAILMAMNPYEPQRDLYTEAKMREARHRDDSSPAQMSN